MTTQSQQHQSLTVGSPSTLTVAATTTTTATTSTSTASQPTISIDSSASKLEKKPFEMNTYIQLEMDTNNCNCVPRVCKFCITKLSLQTDLDSVILAVKLHVSKRSLRTVEIPILKNLSSTSISKQSSADLNLNYNITYPHFLKKDSNYLYFYIQRRKKYKSRTILGYKTLAYTFIDLASVLQRPFSKDLPLIVNKNLNKLSELSHSKLNKPINYNQIIGTLKIQSLVSQPIEIMDETSNYFRNTTDQLKLNDMDEDMDEFDELNEYLANKMENDTNQNKVITCVASDSENEITENSNRLINKKDENTEHRKVTSSNSKNLTGKIISFIRKLRNDNENENETEADANNMMMNDQNDTMLLNEGDEDDFDIYDIEQISDYTDSDDQDQDAYSIVSTPKPKLEPYFSNSNIDMVFKNDTKSIDKKSINKQETVKSTEKDEIRENLNSSKPRKSTDSENHVKISTRKSSSFRITNNNLIEKIESKLNNLLNTSSLTSNDYDISFILIDDSDNLLQILTTISSEQEFILITSYFEIRILFETILKWFLAQTSQNIANKNNILTNLISHIKLILIGNDQYFNKYAQIYVELLKTNENLIQFLKHFFIPRSTSILATYMCKLSHIYNSLFGDEFWSKLDTDMKNVCYKDVESRIIKYVNLSWKDYSVLPLQIGEIMLNQQSDESTPQFLPFLFDIRIGFPTKYQQTQQSNEIIDNNIIDLTKYNQISKSNSLTHFNNNNSSILTTNSASNSPALIKTNDRLFQYANTSSSSSVNTNNNTNSNSNRYSPPNSPITSINSNDEMGYNLQLDYWTICTSLSSTFSTPTMLSNMSINNKMTNSSNSNDLINSLTNTSISNSSNLSKTNKSSTKALFKSLHIYRSQLIKTTLNNTPLQSSSTFNSNITSNTNCNNNDSQNLTIIYVIKEKKQKIMRLSKKSKESDNKRETVEGLTRLVCTSRYHNIPLDVFIDDLEYNNIKFLQISSLWQGKVKFINIMIP